ncbi:MAG: histidine phosphatase family protein [Firmicutes bacterium]|nr:histidine phosphatase family protein [Bacillota bacterium]
MKIGYDREKSEKYGQRFGVVILAAGLSSRMKDFKPLLHVAGTTAVEGLIESAKAAGIEDITVVTGYNREKLAPVIAAHGVREVYNESYSSGMFSSIKTGLSAVSGKDGYLLMPVDCPLISVRVMRMMMDAVSENRKSEDFAVAVFEGKKGHPLYIPAAAVKEICESDGCGGLAAITDRHRIMRIETGEEGCLLDMDTPEGYADIRAFVSKGFAREKLELLTARKRIILVRHGETKQHDEPMFIGQYDVPLSDKGRMQAEALGREIAEMIIEDVEAEALGMDKFGREPMPAIERIYCSDLGRTVETAEIICGKVNDILPEPVYVKKDSGLREINLGDWDGRPVSEIRSEYPEEYVRRGSELFSYKRREGGGENFYDLQYRVLAAFREILRNDDGKNIIIVAHSGVIRVLENNINGMKVDDRWIPMEKGTLRAFEPFPLQPSEKANDVNKPMSSDELTLESVLEYYE